MRPGRKRDIARVIFIAAVAFWIAAGAFGVGMYSGVRRNAVFEIVKGTLSDVKLVIAEFQNL